MSSASESRPNVLLIHSDQHRYDCLGGHGHDQLETPNLDSLAADGMDFEHAFTTIPLCTPARTSLLTGQWAHNHRCIANSDTEAPRGMRDGVPTYSEALSRAGYDLGYVGKWHVDGERSPLAFGFDDYVPRSQYAAWRRARGLPDRPRENDWFGEVDPGIEPRESELGWGADRIIEQLERYAASDGPFFVRWDPFEPHLPNVVPEPYASMYDPADLDPWPGFDDDLAGKPYIQAQQRRTWEVDGWEWSDWAPMVSRYLGEITLMDHQIGRVLDALDRLGLADDTLVVYTTDHGDMCGGHGMIDKHYVMYEDVVHVPLIVRWPGETSAGTVSDAFVSQSIDLASTFLDVAGVDESSTFQGESLVPALRGGDTGREDIYATYHGNQFGLYTQRMVRNTRYKYVWNATAPDELYDLQDDPGELENLARRDDHAAELDRLRDRLVDWMERVDDPVLNMWTRPMLAENRTV